MSCCLPFAKEQRQLLGDWFKRFPNGSQLDLDAFRLQHPDFEYLSVSTLITKRRQLLTLGILSPVNQDDLDAIERGKANKPKSRKPYHPAERHYRNVREANRLMRNEVHI